MQLIVVLESQLADITNAQLFGIVTSFLAAGVLLTDATIGLDNSQTLAQPKNPYYGLRSDKPKESRLSFFGLYMFHVFFFAHSAFSASVLYLSSGSFSASCVLLLVEFVVLCCIKGYQGELFGFGVISSPSKFDYFLGPSMKFGYLLSSYLWFFQSARLPCELGPHLYTGMLIYRYICNFAILFFFLPKVLDSDASPWLTLQQGWILSSAVATISSIGFYIFFTNLNEDFDKSRIYTPISGKEYILEIWNAPEIYH